MCLKYPGRAEVAAGKDPVISMIFINLNLK